MHLPRLFLLLLVWWAPEMAQAAQEGGQDPAVATVQEQPVSRSELEAAAAPALEKLELERLQFEAEQTRKRHQVYQETSERLIADRLIELEAKARNITPQQLIETEIEAKVQEPTQAEIDRVYEANKDRLPGARIQVDPRIRAFLIQQSREKARANLVDALRAKYPVESMLPPLRVAVDSAGHPSDGPASAPVVIVEFSDFQCPYCTQMSATLKRIRERYPEQVRLVFRQFPLSSIHPQAQKAAEASLCAREQNAFWKMHDLMFQDRARLSVSDLKAKAGTLGLDTEAFSNCLDSGKYARQVADDLNAGIIAGVTGTPALFINGRPLGGAVSFEELSAIIEAEIQAAAVQDR